jgi:hypothetical protein
VPPRISSWTNVSVIHQSGSEGTLPLSDVIYVSAGATHPLDSWLDALRPSGRLLFPLKPTEGADGAPGVGGMLLIKRVGHAGYNARFICRAAFIPCTGARDEAITVRLSEAFGRGGLQDVLRGAVQLPMLPVGVRVRDGGYPPSLLGSIGPTASDLLRNIDTGSSNVAHRLCEI